MVGRRPALRMEAHRRTSAQHDLARAAIEGIETRAPGDPQSAVARGQRRDDPLLAERGSVPRPVTRRFRRDRIQSCQAIVCGEPDELILILVEIMGDGDSSACLIGRSALLEAPRQRIVQVERVVSTDPYPARAVPRQGLTNDEPDALRILAIRKGTPALGRGTIDAKESRRDHEGRKRKGGQVLPRGREPQCGGVDEGPAN